VHLDAIFYLTIVRLGAVFRAFRCSISCV